MKLIIVISFSGLKEVEFCTGVLLFDELLVFVKNV